MRHVRARAAAAKLYGSAADVLFLAAGPASLGALSETSARQKVYAIGADILAGRIVPPLTSAALAAWKPMKR